MTWQRAPVALAISEILADLDPAIGAFAAPPETINPPAYVCGFARTVDFDLPTFGVDRASFTVMALAGPLEPDRLDSMLAAAKDALRQNETLFGVAIHSRPTQQTNWRRLNIAGADVLAAEITLEIRM